MAERSVGLIVMTEIPGRGLVAVLRERGWWNFEKTKPLKWPGCSQATASGKLEEGEDFRDALFREVREELGTDFTLRFNSHLDHNPAALVEVDRFQKGDMEVVTYAVKLDCTLLGKIRLSPEAGCLRLVRQEEVEDIHELHPDPDPELKKGQEANGVLDHGRKLIAMFPEVKQALGKAFARFL